jgi:hypothetical protein
MRKIFPPKTFQTFTKNTPKTSSVYPSAPSFHPLTRTFHP